jgi:ABC-2 type transport system permease protein
MSEREGPQRERGMSVDDRVRAAPVERDAPRPPAGAVPAWRVVAGRECRDLWVAGRGPVLVVSFGLLLSLVTYLVATNRVLNYLEQRETVGLLLQVAVGVGVLVAMLVSADAISGERERRTLETLLLAPAARRHLAVGKLLAALSLWLACLCVSVPYVWALGQGVSLVGPALALGALVGTALAVGLAALGLIVSGLSGSNRVSLATSLFLLLALFAPTQLPASAQQGRLGDLLVRANPVAAGEHYLGAVLVNGHGWTRDLFYLAAPVLTAVLGVAVLALAAERLLRLEPGESGR